MYHKSVLTKEVLEYLNIKKNGVYLDATFGGGGHTGAILEQEPTCKVIALDWDKNAIEINGPKLKEIYQDRLKLIWGNFAIIYKIFKENKLEKFDGILADFGTSQYQIKNTPGFSFSADTPLDMRMNNSYSQLRASDVLNNFDQRKLEKIFFELGEERYSRQIARAIIEYRKKESFKTTRQLAELIESITPRDFDRKYKIHPATRVFQALRIFVNKELENIEIFLKASLGLLKPEARLVFISFHSLEDRIVKNFFKENKDKLEILTTKPIIAGEEELRVNLSSRSAKLRAAKFI